MLGQSIVGVLLAILLAPVGDTRLADAAMQGDGNGVRSLLAQKADVNAPQGDGSTAIHWAVYRDDMEMTQLLLKAGANVNAATRLGDITPLFMASRNGNAAIIELLVKAGADAKAPNSAGTTPLMLAAASGKVDAVKALLDHQADVNAKEAVTGETALMFAAALNRVSIINLLKERSADVNAVSTVLEPRTNEFRSRNTADRNLRAKRGPWLGGLTALHFAAREGHMAAVRALIAAGANINIVAAADKTSAMTFAIVNGHFDIAKFLLDNGADPNLVSDAGVAPLFATIDQQWAARTWYPAGNVEQQQTGYLDLMNELLAHGANPNVRMGPKLWYRQFHGDWVDPEGATAFWRAAQADDVAAMKLLVARGADPKIPTVHGASPLQVAAGYGYEPQVSNFAPDSRAAAIKYLVEELGADVNAKDDKGFTPLHGVALFGDNEMIKYLVSKGADVKTRANMTYGRSDEGNKDVAVGTGDSVADFANGARERNQVFAETISLLRQLGAPFSDDCRASTCVLKTQQDKVKEEKKRP